MKKFLVILGIIILTIIIGVGALFYGVKSYLTPEKVSSLLSEKLESTLHHKVKLGPVTTGFSSAKVQGFSLLPNNPKDKTSLVKVENISFSFSLIPLLKKKLDIKKVVIAVPNIYVVREENGKLNWQEEFPKVSFNIDRGLNNTKQGWFSFVSVAHAAETADPKSKGFIVRVGKVEIREGRILWVDHAVSPVYKATLTSMALDLEDFSLDRPFSFQLKGRFKREKESAIQMKGKMDLARKDLKGDLALTSFFLPDISPYLKNKGIKITNGTGDMDLKISSRQFKVWEIDQKMTLQSVSFEAQGGKTQPVKASLNMEATLDLEKDSLSLKNVDGKVAKSDFKLNGKLEKLHNTPKGTLHFTSNRMDIDTLMGLFGITQKAPGERKAKKAPAANTKKKVVTSPSHRAKTQKKPLPTLPALTIQAKIHTLIVQKLKIEEIAAKIVTKPDGAVLDPFSAKMYGGTVKGSIYVDLKSGVPVIRKKVSFKNIDVAPLLSDLKPGMKEKFTGHFFGNAEARGVVGAPSTYDGKVSFHVEKGSIRNVNVLKMAAAIMKLPSLIDLKFDSLKGNALVKDSQVKIVNAEAKGKDVSFDTKGTIGFDKKLALNAKLELPYKVIRKGLGKRSDLFEDRKDAVGRKWSIIPLRVKGTLERPLISVKFGEKAVEKIIKKNVHDKKIKKLLKKLFN